MRQTKIPSVTYKIVLHKVGAAAKRRTVIFRSFHFDLRLGSRNYISLNILNQVTTRESLSRTFFSSKLFLPLKFLQKDKSDDTFVSFFFFFECTERAERIRSYFNRRLRPCYCAYISISRVSSYSAALAWQRRRQFGPDSSLS